jgi:hypothetical protein
VKVQQLREALAKFPDDAEVVTRVEGNPCFGSGDVHYGSGRFFLASSKT